MTSSTVAAATARYALIATGDRAEWVTVSCTSGPVVPQMIPAVDTSATPRQ
jgi:hypothetical protein